jgi:glycosyltransferase involved in cell wall biosynthesis
MLCPDFQRRPIQLLFVGSGILGAELRQACSVVFDAEGGRTVAYVENNKPVASFVSFLNQSDIVRAYVAADLLVLPSDSGETWGLVANEAMACGTPAVVSNQCGCAEDLVAPLDQRFVFQCGKVDELARAIRYATEVDLLPDGVQAAVQTHHLRHTVNSVRTLFERNDAMHSSFEKAR